MIAVLFAALAIFSAQLPEKAEEQSEKPSSSVLILDREFPLGDRYRPGRWFPMEIVLRAEKDWDGILWVQLSSGGPIFEKNVKLAKGERRAVSICVLPGRNIEGVAVDTGAAAAKFSGPFPDEALRVLLVGPASQIDAMRRELAASPDLGRFQTEVEQAWAIEATRLPDELYSLDAFDLIFLHEQAIASLPIEKKELLLRWAVIRGRLFTSDAGKKKWELKPAQFAWVEVTGESGAGTAPRRFPTHYQAPDRFAPLQAKHFARASDPAFWVLALFGVAILFAILKKRPTDTWSRPALVAGLAAVCLIIPGIGWPARTPVWRNLVLHEGMPGFVLEDRAQGKSLPLTISPKEHLLIPRVENRFLVEWSQDNAQARFFQLDGERRLFQAMFLEGRQIYREGDASPRNGFAPLEAVVSLFRDQAKVQVRSHWDIAQDLQAQPPLDAFSVQELARPLRDFLAAPWVSGEWILGRISSQDPSPATSPFGSAPAASYLLWFPRPRR